jgi:hypothetical protein
VHPRSADGVFAPENKAEDGRFRNLGVRRLLIHTAIFIAAIVLISLTAVWFGLGPVVHSAPVPPM